MTYVGTRTSDEHGDDAEDLLGERVGRHVAEAHAGERRAREVQRRHVALTVRDVRDRHL